jgi:hypothetical protein
MTVVPSLGANRGSSNCRNDADTVLMRGDDQTMFSCGGCDAPILDGVAPEELKRLFFRCKGCGATLTVPD